MRLRALISAVFVACGVAVMNVAIEGRSLPLAERLGLVAGRVGLLSWVDYHLTSGRTDGLVITSFPAIAFVMRDAAAASFREIMFSKGMPSAVGGILVAPGLGLWARSDTRRAIRQTNSSPAVQPDRLMASDLP
jgi:hypothetical protein